MATLRPIHDRIVVKRIAQPVAPTALIFIPDEIKDPGEEGLVMAVGPGVYQKGKLITPTIKAGDRILFGKGLGYPVTVGKETFLMMRESDVMGVLS